MQASKPSWRGVPAASEVHSTPVAEPASKVRALTKAAVLARRGTVILWALALALLVPLFFFHFGGQWLRQLAELWPLGRP
jgi:hypothetical protein